MRKLLPLLLLVALALAAPPLAPAQDAFAGIDLLYPEFAHPQQDVQAAIKAGDFRFIATDPRRRIVPGMEKHRAIQRKYGTKFLRQRFRIFATRSQNFSFNLRARAYATEYNQALLHYLLEREEKGKNGRDKR